MAVSMEALAADLAAESAALRARVSGLPDREWLRDTPSPGWTVADQVSHLAHFDEAAIRSATDADAFRQELTRIGSAGGNDPDRIAASYRHLRGEEILRWFDDTRSRLISTFRTLDPKLRLPWFGPPMSAASSLTARVMETWAHGQDVADALGVDTEPTERLRHVAHIGVGARAYSLSVNGLEADDAPIRVEIAAPDGSTWTWGPAGAADRVSGAALDFCLAVTQRRHLDDLDLVVEGPHARQWMSVAQAFAGGAGPGRAPGVVPLQAAPRGTDGGNPAPAHRHDGKARDDA